MNTASKLNIKELKNGKVLLELSIDNKIIGRLKLDTFDSPILYIEYLHVDKKWRRARFATRLLVEAVKQAKISQCNIISLYVRVNNVPALSFYARLDFFMEISIG